MLNQFYKLPQRLLSPKILVNFNNQYCIHRSELHKISNGETLRYTEYVYGVVGLNAVLAGGPHYVGFPTAYPSYLFNVSFALVTIQISSSFSIPRHRHRPISLVSSLIIGRAMFNNDNRAHAVTVCPNRKHSFPVEGYVVS